MKTVKHRRNHVLAALGLIVSAVLLVAGSTQPVLTVSGPQVSVGFMKLADIGLDPTVSSGLDDDSKTFLLVAAAIVFAMGLVLLVTRIRFLGLLWRLIALGALAAPAFLAYAWWGFASDPGSVIDGASETSDSGIGTLISGAAGAAEALRLMTVTPGPGLWILLVGTGLGALSCLIPAFRSEKVIASTSLQAGSPGAGWYVNSDNPGLLDYWDGRAWTARRPRGDD